MQRIIYTAAALLIIQLGLVIAFNAGSRHQERIVPDQPFISINPDLVTSISISDSTGNSLNMTRNDAGWVLPDQGNLPANGTEIAELLKRLAAAKKGFAVATTADAAPRFKVSTDSFERHLVIKQGTETAADFYVGTSAGFRQSHVRNSGDNDIVTIGIGTFDIEPQLDNWLDKTLLKRNRDDISAIRFPDFTLVRSGDQWSFAGKTGNTDQPNPKQLESLLDSICGMTVMSVLQQTTAASSEAGKTGFDFSITTGDQEIRYQFVRLAEDEKAYALNVSDFSQRFKIYEWQVEELMSFDHTRLITPPDTHKTTSSDDGTSSPSATVPPSDHAQPQ